VVIEGLVNNEECQFQVAAIAVLDGDMSIGQRSMLSTILVALPVTTGDGPNCADLNPFLGMSPQECCGCSCMGTMKLLIEIKDEVFQQCCMLHALYYGNVLMQVRVNMLLLHLSLWL
jgi:hypothetical protein